MSAFPNALADLAKRSSLNRKARVWNEIVARDDRELCYTRVQLNPIP
jgi:hypothetical protein